MKGLPGLYLSHAARHSGRKPRARNSRLQPAPGGLRCCGAVQPGKVRSLQTFKGVPVSAGVVIGRAFVIEGRGGGVPERFVRRSDTAREVGRFRAAVETARQQVQALAGQAAEKLGEGAGTIFDAHLWILSDKALHKDIAQRIERNRFTAEYAVSRAFRRYAQAFTSMRDEYLAARIHDVQDVEQRLLSTLTGTREQDLSGLREAVIVVAHDLTPSQTASFPREKVLGFAVDVGGPTSHSAILARARQIPAVVGLEKASSAITSGAVLIIDGNRGLVVVEPDRRTLARYRRAAERIAAFDAAIALEKDLPAVSADGVAFKVLANMEFPEEVEAILRHGADGVGLFRTEFLYLRSGRMPTEEEHYQAYASTAERLAGRPLVIRTFDLGADKIAWEGDTPTREQNPFLGCRSIRLSQHRPETFRVQLRAILRAAGKHPNISVMVPMVTVEDELTWTRQQVARVSEELSAEGVRLPRKLAVGMMVEVPAAALQARCFAAQADFFSIGTNDLIQYTLAVDRTNQTVAGLYSPAHPAVLELIRTVIAAGEAAGIPVAMCGEMAGDPLFAILLAGMGLREFSVTPPQVPELKKIIRSVRVERARRLAEELATCTSAAQITARLRQELEVALPGAGEPPNGEGLGT